MAAFNHGIEHDRNPKNLKVGVLFGLTENPVRNIPRIVKKEKAGERDLNRAELATFWQSLDEYQCMDHLTKMAFRLVLATGGQRIKEVIEAPWSEFDFDRKRWEMPSRRTKNKNPHVVPLNDLALSILDELRAFTGDSRYLFPKRGDNKAPMPLASMSKALARYCEKTDFERFTPRDLRRTCKSRMGELGLSKEIRDRLHNHALQDVSSKHYDRYDYLPDMCLTWMQYVNGWRAAGKRTAHHRATQARPQTTGRGCRSIGLIWRKWMCLSERVLWCVRMRCNGRYMQPTGPRVSAWSKWLTKSVQSWC